jgi:hypothetical protein
MRRLSLILLACVAAAGCGNARHPGAAKRQTAATDAARGAVVLGAKDFVSWHGRGFGTPHPSKLLVGGDPSVLITQIRWRGWGGPTASAVGRYAAPDYKHGGYYHRKRLRAVLRAARIGRCSRNGPRSYMSLKVHVALQPGQRPQWYELAGSHGLCSYP